MALAMNADATAAYLKAIDPGDAAKVIATGMDMVRGGIGAPVIPLVRDALVHHPRDAVLWQLLGLAARLEQDGALALEAFARAAELAPNDALIAQSHAQAALEAGRPAVGLFDRAAILAPQHGAVLLGRAAAMVAAGRSDESVRGLRRLLAANPLWIDGHRALAKIVGQLGHFGDPRASLAEALVQARAVPELHQALIATDFDLADYAAADRHLADARTVLPPARWLDSWSAFCASELSEIARADSLFEAMGSPADIDEALRRSRHEIRAGRAGRALAIAEAWTARDGGGVLWPYLELGWRLTDDPRWQWLEGDRRFVGVYDLSHRLESLTDLAGCLRKLHFADRQPLDQSLRGGTQTDGPLLSRLEPEIAALRKVILSAVRDYAAQLPPPDPGHPLLLAHRAPLKFAGSWSVRLTRQGFHVDHVHSQGWISSAFYIALPEPSMGRGEGERAHDGWLSLGECRELAPGLAPIRLIEPKPGRLVLFPSTMWHGTRPFAEGERLTVAFDVARPRPH